MTRAKKPVFVLLGLSMLLVTACFSPYGGDGGNLVISLGGMPRAAGGLGEDDYPLLSHTITVSGGPGPEQTRGGVKLGKTEAFTVAPGNWNIVVKAYLDGVPRAHGKVLNREIGSGSNPPIIIKMNVLDPGLYRETREGYELVPGEGLTGLSGIVTSGAYFMLVEGIPGAAPAVLDAGRLTLFGINSGDEPAFIALDEDESGRSLFTVKSGAELILGNKIGLRGIGSNTAPLVRAEDGGKLVMEKGSVISGNNNSDLEGGGVYVGSGGKFTMNEGEISGNLAASGGGVFVADGGEFTMSGGGISDNTATSGGGVYVEDGGSFTKGGGVIYGNDADAAKRNTANGGNTNGYAVYAAAGSRYRDSTAEADDVMDSGVSGGEGGWENGVTPPVYEAEIVGDKEYETLQEALNNVPADTETTIEILRDINNSPPEGYTIDAGVNVTITADSALTIHKKTAGSLFAVKSGAGFTLGNNITLQGFNENTAALVSVTSGNLTMQSGSKITGNKNKTTNGGGVYVSDTGTFNMEGGEISGNEAGNGGGVYVEDGGSFTKDGGVIYGNDADAAKRNTAGDGSEGFGHAAYVAAGSKYRDSTAEADDDLDSGEEGRAGGWENEDGGSEPPATAGLYKMENGTWAPTGVPIDDTGILSQVIEKVNSEAGDYFFVADSFNVGTAISAISSGRALTIKSLNQMGEDSGFNSIITLQDYISGSLLTVGGGASLILDSVTLKGHGNNNAALVTVSGGSLTMNAGSKITGNTNSNYLGDGGGVYITGGSFTMNNGAEISGNKAPNGSGGGVYVDVGTFIKNGGILYGNEEVISEELQNTAGGGSDGLGHAAYVADGSKYRDSTAGNDATGKLDSEQEGRAGGWENGTTLPKSVGLYTVTESGGTTTYGGKISDVIDNDIATAVTYVKGKPGAYLLLLDDDQTVTEQLTLSAASTVTLTIQGLVSERIVSFQNGSNVSQHGRNFKIGSNGRLILGENITFTVTGEQNVNDALVRLDNATARLTMMNDSCIRGNDNRGTNNSFSDNRGGGVNVCAGIFEMKGGVISGNSDDYYGGGVYVHSGIFRMTGGEIKGNTGQFWGGGVFVRSGGTFTKTDGGTIYGETGTDEQNKVNVYDGDAVWAGAPQSAGTTYHYRDSAADMTDNIDTGDWTGFTDTETVPDLVW